MATLIKKKKVTKSRKVKQSELGMFIDLIHKDNPVTSIPSKKRLAEMVSEEFDVDCRRKDIITFYNLEIMDEDYERESRREEFKE